MYELKRTNSPVARSRRGNWPALTFPAFAGAVHPRRRRTASNCSWLWKRRGKGSEAMVIIGVDCEGARKREEPGARKPIARRDAEMKGRYGVCCWQERKGSRSLRRKPFMQKAAPTLASCGDRGEVERLPAPPSPSLTLNDQWSWAYQSLAWVLEGRGKGRIRTARAARRARIRQESEPSDAHGACGGRAPRGSRYGRKDIHALARRE
jgi:hypothetical protein